jgi:hypothetical protein
LSVIEKSRFKDVEYCENTSQEQYIEKMEYRYNNYVMLLKTFEKLLEIASYLLQDPKLQGELDTKRHSIYMDYKHVVYMGQYLPPILEYSYNKFITDRNVVKSIGVKDDSIKIKTKFKNEDFDLYQVDKKRKEYFDVLSQFITYFKETKWLIDFDSVKVKSKVKYLQFIFNYSYKFNVKSDLYLLSFYYKDYVHKNNLENLGSLYYEYRPEGFYRMIRFTYHSIVYEKLTTV